MVAKKRHAGGNSGRDVLKTLKRQKVLKREMRVI
jgi:hypothetical protein